MSADVGGFLKREGFHIDCVVSGSAGLAMARDTRYQAIILDSVEHFPHETESQAVQTVRMLVLGSSVGFRSIKGYGDEVYVSDTTTLDTGLITRRGTTVLRIGSRDGPAVLKFAELFVREVEQPRGEGLVR